MKRTRLYNNCLYGAKDYTTEQWRALIEPFLDVAKVLNTDGSLREERGLRISDPLRYLLQVPNYGMDTIQPAHCGAIAKRLTAYAYLVVQSGTPESKVVQLIKGFEYHAENDIPLVFK